MSTRAGIDVGGTFTDGVLLNEQGRLAIAKVASTPGDLTAGFLDARTELKRSVELYRDLVGSRRIEVAEGLTELSETFMWTDDHVQAERTARSSWFREWRLPRTPPTLPSRSCSSPRIFRRVL